MAVIGSTDYSSGHMNFAVYTRQNSLADGYKAEETSDHSQSTLARAMTTANLPYSNSHYGQHLITQQIRKLLNCHKDLRIHKALCPRHETSVITLASDTHLIVHNEKNITSQLDETLEKRLLDCLIQLRQIYRCSECRKLLKKTGTLRSTQGEFLQLKQLFHCLAKRSLNCIDHDVFQYLENTVQPAPVKTTMAKQTPLAVHVNPQPKQLDKSDYCWNWLLCSVNDDTPSLESSEQLPTSFDCASLLSVDTTFTDLSPSASADPLRSSNCTSSPSDCSVSGAQSSRKSSLDFDHGPEFSHVYPHHVTRKKEDRSRTAPQQNRLQNRHYHMTPSYLSSKQNSLLQTGSRKTPWFATSTEEKFDQHLWSALSSMNLCAYPEEERVHQNSQTIDFLSSISPTMNIIPPPNHNPFAKNESV